MAGRGGARLWAADNDVVSKVAGAVACELRVRARIRLAIFDDTSCESYIFDLFPQVMVHLDSSEMWHSILSADMDVHKQSTP